MFLDLKVTKLWGSSSKRHCHLLYWFVHLKYSSDLPFTNQVLPLKEIIMFQDRIQYFLQVTILIQLSHFQEDHLIVNSISFLVILSLRYFAIGFTNLISLNSLKVESLELQDRPANFLQDFHMLPNSISISSPMYFNLN